MSFPRYPKYKPSGVEWLGEVPEGWSVAPFKRQIARNDGGVWGEDPDGISDTIVLRSTEQTVDGRWQLDNPASRKLSGSDIDGALLGEGDLLLTKSSGSSLHIGKTTLVTAEIAEMRCCYSNFMQRIRTKPTFLPKLAWYVLNNQLARQQLDLVSNSTTGLANLNATMVGQLVVIVPPLPEQTAIASFLDHETAKIDALIAEQQRLIELLKEKRQAVISHAVTKGLNPDAPMKASGIEWLGDVPEHWVCLQVGKVCRAVSDGPHFSPNYVETGVPFLSARNVKVDGWSLDDAKYVSQSDCDIFDRRVIPEIGDVLYTKGGTTGVARVVDLNFRFQVWVHIAVLKIIPEKVDPYFLAFALNSVGCYEQSQLFTRGATNNDLGLTRMIKILFALAPLDEQRLIVQRMNELTIMFDTLTAEAQRAIDLLQERRTALISAAVTGQIDVRQQPRN